MSASSKQLAGSVMAPLTFKAPCRRYIAGRLLLTNSQNQQRRGELLQRCALSTSSSPRTASPGPSSSPSSSSSSSSPSSSSSSSSPPLPSSDDISWKQYLKLRKQRRFVGNFFSFPTTMVAGITSSNYFLNQEIDPTSTIAGIDPVYVNIGLTLGCSALGFLAGPTVGNFVWSLLHSKQKQSIEAKDRAFFEHIRANRVDPSRQTMQNRLPDHYGEKIGSIEEYRQWLRDQAAFRRKAAHGVDDDAKAM